MSTADSAIIAAAIIAAYFLTPGILIGARAWRRYITARERAADAELDAIDEWLARIKATG